MVKMYEDELKVAEAKLHLIVKTEDGGFGIDDGTAVPFHEVAELLEQGDNVWVLVPSRAGTYRTSDRVRKRSIRGRTEHIESYDEQGNATSALFNLPRL
jgi:hypothetical protein